MSVGIIDSVYDPSGDFDQYNNLERKQRLVDTKENHTSPHGTYITGIITNITADPDYHFYQIADKHGSYDDRDLVTAIVWAADRGVDVLNLSLGSDHISNKDKDCSITGPSCAVAEAVEYAKGEGAVVVSAVGNEPAAQSVCCPALSDHSIAVGGCVAKCNASIQEDDKVINPGQLRPPGAIWVERPDDLGLSGQFCSTKGCTFTEDCESNREITEWSGNPKFVSNTPDTLAPVYYPVGSSKGPILEKGTSFAVPIVVGGLINILGILRERNKVAGPEIIRRNLRISGNSVNDVPVGVFNAHQLANELVDEQDL